MVQWDIHWAHSLKTGVYILFVTKSDWILNCVFISKEIALTWMLTLYVVRIDAHLKNRSAHPKAVRVKNAQEKAGRQQQRTGVLICSFDHAELKLSCCI